MGRILFTLFFVLQLNTATAEEYDDANSYGNSKAQEYDPLEQINRAIYEFNNVVDGVLLDPLARGYNQAVPTWVRNRVSNVVYNMGEPVTVLNSVLQGDDENAFTSLWRFLINSTFGILGTYDAATELGLEARSEGFGQTLAVWGIGETPYIVLPIRGPSTLSNLVGGIADGNVNPFNHSHVFRAEEVIAYNVTAAVDAKASTVRITDDIKANALDPYATLRSVYLQNFRSQVSNGN